jgi:hypothetical protein
MTHTRPSRLRRLIAILGRFASVDVRAGPCLSVGPCLSERIAEQGGHRLAKRQLLSTLWVWRVWTGQNGLSVLGNL